MTIHQYAQNADLSPHERGLDLGRRFKSEILTAVKEYQQFFQIRGLTESGVAHQVDTLRKHIGEWAPEQLQEIEGLAKGSGAEIAEIIALNARTEIMAAAPPEDDGECSTAVLVPSSGATPRTVQTWDWKPALSKEMLVRSYRNSAGRGVVVFSEFGQLGKIGVNSAGLGLHFNILVHTSDASTSGVPVHTVAKKILDEATTVEEAVQIANSAPLAASTVITVVTKPSEQTGVGEAACIELSPAGVGVIPAAPDVPLVHTNHFIDPVLATGNVQSPGTTTFDRFSCATDIAERVLNVEDPFERAQTFTAVENPMDMVPDSQAAWHRVSVTKATIVLDLKSMALQYCLGSASRSDRQAWQVFP